MNDERHDLNEILRVHGSAPDHLPGFEARLLTGLDEADHEMGRVTVAGSAGRMGRAPSGRVTPSWRARSWSASRPPSRRLSLSACRGSRA